MMGPSQSGKSTILRRLSNGQVACRHTFVICPEWIHLENMDMICLPSYDLSRVRPLLQTWLEEADAIVFVIDSSHEAEIDAGRKYLSMWWNAPELHNSVFLIYANKQDLPNAIPVPELE
jgi:signal recognition particle receptor subunit beta